MQAMESNRWVFDFLRKRAAFVKSSVGIEGLIVWGAVTDAIATLHASRLGQPRQPNWRCFQTGVTELVRSVNLRTVSVPLLHHGLRQLVRAGDDEAEVVFRAAFGDADTGIIPNGLIWTIENDRLWQSKISTATTELPSKPLRKLLRNATYAGILYSDYRCPLVHGLSLGWRTWPGSEALGPGLCDDAPTYMNYLYSDDDPRPAHHRGRIRISFGSSFLVRILDEMIEHEERESAAQDWIISGYATLEEST
jgi:hypothetical protein